MCNTGIASNRNCFPFPPISCSLQGKKRKATILLMQIIDFNIKLGGSVLPIILSFWNMINLSYHLFSWYLSNDRETLKMNTRIWNEDKIMQLLIYHLFCYHGKHFCERGQYLKSLISCDTYRSFIRYSDCKTFVVTRIYNIFTTMSVKGISSTHLRCPYSVNMFKRKFFAEIYIKRCYDCEMGSWRLNS